MVYILFNRFFFILLAGHFWNISLVPLAHTIEPNENDVDNDEDTLFIYK